MISATSKGMITEKIDSLLKEKDELQSIIDRVSAKLDSLRAKKAIIVSQIQELRNDEAL